MCARTVGVLVLSLVILGGTASPSAASWVSGGTSICTAVSYQRDPDIVSDGAGGAIVVWEDNRSGTKKIYAQRIDASGAVQWSADGVVVCNASGNKHSPLLIPDGSGGAIAVWLDYRAGHNDIYAQRIAASGAMQWTIDGVAICTASGNQQIPEIATDGAGGAVISWYDFRGGGWDVYTQRIDASGVVQWTADGVAVCTASGDQRNTHIASDGAGGAVITWWDARTGPTRERERLRTPSAGERHRHFRERTVARHVSRPERSQSF